MAPVGWSPSGEGEGPRLKWPASDGSLLGGLGLAPHTEFDAPERVTGEPTLLRHLVSNPVANALQCNRPQGLVDVTLHGGTLHVTTTGLPVDPSASRASSNCSDVWGRTASGLWGMAWGCPSFGP